jgi:predicted SnoaL-like aldol condensation-catalyzing enzyme
MEKTTPQRNKELLIEGFNTLFNKRDFAAAEKLWSQNYIQHSGHIPPGREGLFGLVKTFPPGVTWDHGLIMAENDFVMVHSRYSMPDGAELIVMDIMRMKDGIFEEHWDVSEPARTEAESKSKRPMFGDQFPTRSWSESPAKDAW